MEHDKYVCFKRFHGEGISGQLNIKYGTELVSIGNFIRLKDNNALIVCAITSDTAHQYFAINNDGRGLERGDYTTNIQTILAKGDEKHQQRWDKIWGDATANNLRRKDYDDYWLWGKEFYEASIEDLDHILNLIKEV